MPKDMEKKPAAGIQGINGAVESEAASKEYSSGSINIDVIQENNKMRDYPNLGETAPKRPSGAF